MVEPLVEEPLIEEPVLEPVRLVEFAPEPTLELFDPVRLVELLEFAPDPVDVLEPEVEPDPALPALLCANAGPVRASEAVARNVT